MNNIIHVWSHLTGPGNPEPTENTRRRLALALRTWKEAAAVARQFDILWEILGVHRNALNRNSTDLGDPRPVAYKKDVINAALVLTEKPEDIILITNSDICVAEDMGVQIVDSVNKFGSAFTHRYDFSVPIDEPKSIPEILKGCWYPGSDLFAFSVSWWHDLGNKLFPDMLLGREGGDCVLRNLIKKTGGTEIHSRTYHEDHVSDWESDIRTTLPGNIHNLKLANQYFAEHGGSWDDWK